MKFSFSFLLILGMMAYGYADQDSATCSGEVDVKYYGNGIGYSRYTVYDVKLNFLGNSDLEMYVDEGINRTRNISSTTLSLHGHRGDLAPAYWSVNCYADPNLCMTDVSAWLTELTTAKNRLVDHSQRGSVECAEDILNKFAYRIRTEILQKRTLEGRLN